MADLLTVYDDDQANTFIDCTICNKRIRGDTQYKIHVTTLQHLKKEEALAAQGEIPRPPPLPEWTDIREYLEYLNLDEPIIGLGSLIEVPDVGNDDGKNVLRYKCRMCVVEMDLYNIVAHVVGRKHRQKYLELKRPDLVTWQDNTQKQPGLVARAKAAVVEKQEGWGKPETLYRPNRKALKRAVNQAGSDSRAMGVHEQPYYGRDSHRVEDTRRQSYLDDDRHGRPYKYDQYDRPNPSDAIRQQSYPDSIDNRGRVYQGDDYSERSGRGIHAKPYLGQGGLKRPYPQEGYEEADPGRGQYSGGDGHRIMSRNYQENAYEDVPRNRHNDKDLRTHGAAQHPRSFHEESRRGTVREFERMTWDASNERPGYPQRFEPRDIPGAYSQEPFPAKKKKKSRFSDATAEEIALAHMRHSDEFTHKEKQRGPPIRNTMYNKTVMDTGSISHANTNAENVLDALNNIQIENLEEAKFLKEKLCTVLKEFQANKASWSGGHTSQSASDRRGGNHMEQRRDGKDKDLRDIPDGAYLENIGFQEVGQYEDYPRGFQESRQYEDDPRGFREARLYEDDSRDYRESRHFDSYPSDFQEARQYPVDPRGFQENTRDFPERRGYADDPRVNAGNYKEFSRASQEERHHAEGPRSTQETRYYDDDSGSYGNLDHQRRHPLGRYEEPVSDVDRGFQEGFGRPAIHFQPTSLHEETKMYAERGQKPHQIDCQPGDELYDPFDPSSSPPQDVTNSTSLDKIASTLLELVARR